MFFGMKPDVRRNRGREADKFLSESLRGAGGRENIDKDSHRGTPSLRSREGQGVSSCVPGSGLSVWRSESLECSLIGGLNTGKYYLSRMSNVPKKLLV